jgi:hypothetical protein
MRRALSALVAALSLAAGAPAARAGFYLMPRAAWAAYAPRPEGSEPTPNLYSIGGEVSAGYSARQALDFVFFGEDLPGSLAHARFGAGDASLVSYGGELGLRFAESVYVGFKGGLATYRLSHQSSVDELTGTWRGEGGGFALGAVERTSKTGFVQTTVEFMHYVLGSGEAGGKRRLDSFSLGAAYMWNSKGDAASNAIENTIFKNFLDSIIFF